MALAGLLGMTLVTEQVARGAYLMGYALARGPEGYSLIRQWRNDPEAESLEAIADFLKH